MGGWQVSQEDPRHLQQAHRTLPDQIDIDLKKLTECQLAKIIPPKFALWVPAVLSAPQQSGVIAQV